MKDCETSTPNLPAVGTRVGLIDADIEGTVRGYGYITPEGQQAVPGTQAPMAPVVIVQVEAFWLPGCNNDCWITTITVHPDNLAVMGA